MGNQTQFGGGNRSLEGLMNSPLFNVGLGLLSDQDGNWGQAATQGLLATQRNRDTTASRRELEREREEAQRARERQQQLNEAIQGAINPGGQSGPHPGSQQLTAQQPSAADISTGVNQALMQFGTPQQIAQGAGALASRDRFNQQMALEDDRFQQRSAQQESQFTRRQDFTREQNELNRDAADRRSYLNRQAANNEADPVRSTQILDDGRILNIRRSGKADVVTIGDEIALAHNPLKVQKGPGGTIIATNRITGESRDVVNIDDASQAEAQTAGAKEAAKFTAKDIATVQAEYPTIKATAERALSTIELLRNHPGLKAGTGLSSYFPSVRDASRNFDVALAQAQGQVFLEAYQSLKGGGQITEIEGLKAEQATARLGAAQSTEEFLKALDELQEQVLRGVQRAQNKAGLTGNQASGTVNGVGWSVESQ